MKYGKQWLWTLGAVAVAVVIAIFALSGSGSDPVPTAPPAQTPAAETTPVEPPKPEPIVKNGGFDQDNSWVNLKIKVQQDKDGNFFASNRFNWSFYQEIKLDPDTWYSLDARVRKGLSNTRARICIQFRDSQGAKVGEVFNYYHTFKGTGWESIPTSKFRTPAGTAAATVFLMTEDAATHDFDDIRIAPTTPGTAAPAPQTKPAAPQPAPQTPVTPQTTPQVKPAAPQATAPQPAPAASKQQESMAPAPQGVNYIVASGDTLTHIAKQHITSVDAIANANGIPDVNKIYVHQKLVIPPETK